MLLTAHYNGFSMTDTVPVNKQVSDSINEGKVILTSSVARKVAQDVINAEGLKDINSIMEESRSIMLQTISEQNKIIEKYKFNENDYRAIINNLNTQNKAQNDRYIELEALYKKSVRKSRFKDVIVVGAAAFIVYQFLHP